MYHEVIERGIVNSESVHSYENALPSESDDQGKK
jgi:hypothetical protein